METEREKKVGEENPPGKEYGEHRKISKKLEKFSRSSFHESISVISGKENFCTTNFICKAIHNLHFKATEKCKGTEKLFLALEPICALLFSLLMNTFFHDNKSASESGFLCKRQ